MRGRKPTTLALLASLTLAVFLMLAAGSSAGATQPDDSWDISVIFAGVSDTDPCQLAFIGQVVDSGGNGQDGIDVSLSASGGRVASSVTTSDFPISLPGTNWTFGSGAAGSPGHFAGILTASSNQQATLTASLLGTTVQASNHATASGCSATSPTASPPGVPTGVTASAGDGSATVTWSAPASDGGSPITTYVVASSAGQNTTVSGSSTNATVGNLTNGVSYTFTVTARNAVGPGPASAQSNAVTPTGNGSSRSGGLTITTASPLPAGQVGQPYSVTLAASGGTSPYVWFGLSGAPPAFTLDPTTGQLSGTPSAAGTYTISVSAEEKTGPLGAAKQFTLNVVSNPSTALAITTASSLPAGQVGQPYSVTLAASGGTSPYVWFGLSGAPPAFTLDPTTGQLSGTPSAAGTYTISVSAEEKTGPLVTSKQFELVISSSAGTSGTPGAPTNVRASAGDGSATVNWTAPASDGGSPITGYAVTSSGGQQAAVPGSTTSATVSGLSNGTRYTFTVAASNAIGIGPTSAPSNAITPGAATSPPASGGRSAGASLARSQESHVAAVCGFVEFKGCCPGRERSFECGRATPDHQG